MDTIFDGLSDIDLSDFELHDKLDSPNIFDVLENALDIPDNFVVLENTPDMVRVKALENIESWSRKQRRNLYLQVLNNSSESFMSPNMIRETLERTQNLTFKYVGQDMGGMRDWPEIVYDGRGRYSSRKVPIIRVKISSSRDAESPRKKNKADDSTQSSSVL